MGALIISEFLSLDGFYADADGGLDWVVADDEHHDYSITLLERADLLLFGRTTWEIFESYWPTVSDDPGAPEREVVVGRKLDRLPKIVYSSSLVDPGWRTTVSPAVVREEVEELKARTSGLLVVFGSGELVKDLVREGLVDEFHLLVQPVALGSGLPLFGRGVRTDLVLTSSTALRSGVVRQFYAPAAGPVERINYAS